MSYRAILPILLILLLAAACTAPAAAPVGQPAGAPAVDRDYSSTRTGDNGILRATYTSELDSFALNELHAWTLHVETTEGAPVENAIITVSGGMPEHNHGMPTQPQVTEELGGGDYRVEGIQFQMGGWWTVTFTINAGGVQDSVMFNLQLE
ncbi:FixH family protein [Caldilinea sp.]|uniref:FixH family protein n=1 Tax=Caldilinea sp. TaxID=2293560 RepID=UPI002C4E99ED|nr:FixH family protein [Anaerolineales bacterium]HQY92498.1 FixH family protein [Caldilinea sp.]HRA65210.1 FixH family protein [Caldilinea sp.]